MTSRLYVLTSLAVASGIISTAVSGCGKDESLPGGTIIGNDAQATGGSGGGGSGGRDSGPTARRSSIGARCVTDTDCPGEGIFCLPASGTELLGGGPQGGLCVAECTPSTAGADPCEEIDPNTGCVTVSDSLAVCLETCFRGDPAPGEVKCRDRPELSCFESQPGSGAFCRPTCDSDFNCAPRVCDLAAGVCIDEEDRRTDGLPIGSECDPEAETDPCNDVCQGLVGDTGICSGFCNLSTFGCGSDPSSADPFDSICLLALPDASFGDTGFCGQLCDCNDDCRHPDAVCSPLPSGSPLISQTGRAGFCSISAAGDGEMGIACSDAGTADAAPVDAGSVDARGDAAASDATPADAPGSG